MERAKNISLKGTVDRHAEATDIIREPGDVAIVSRGNIRSLAIKCPDGCGEVISVNLDPRTGPAWKFFQRSNNLTLYPSVWRESGCRAHFILWNNRLVWCDGYDSPNWRDDDVKRRVYKVLPEQPTAHQHFEEIAAKLGLIPWEALWACQSLVAQKSAVSSEKGTRFGRCVPPPTESASRIDRSA
jgi:hypothetical protein